MKCHDAFFDASQSCVPTVLSNVGHSNNKASQCAKSRGQKKREREKAKLSRAICSPGVYPYRYVFNLSITNLRYLDNFW